jgi:spermidine/putrescine transport system ATP-binding protein
MIAGFLAPDSGTIRIDGRDLGRLPPQARGVGLVFQDYALFSRLSVRANLAFGLKAQGVRPQERERRLARIVQRLELGGLLDRPAARLNMSEMQRVALGRALVTEPRLLLLDEPMSNLDAHLRQQLRAELKQIQAALDQTVLYVTHDQLEAMSMSDRIAVMHEGRVMQCGAPEDVYERPSEEFVAGFIGISNLITGTVEDGGKVRIANGLRIDAPLPDGVARGDAVNLSVRPEKIAVDDDVEPGMVSLDGTVEARVYLGVSTQITVSLGNGDRVVALEQATYRSSADDRWEPGSSVKLGWHPEHCLVLR